MFLLRSFFATILLLSFVGLSTAQTVTGTLFGLAYPTNIVQFTNGAYDFPGPVVWIGNHPQIEILGVDTSGQTTFSYHDIFTQNVGGAGAGAPVTVTQNGILVQNDAGLYFSEPPKAAVIPVVQSCAFNKAGAAACEFNNGGKEFTIAATKTPFFTFFAALPTTAASKPASTASKTAGSASRTRQPTKTPSSTASQSATPVPVPVPHKVPIGAIVGAAIGGVVLVTGGLAILLLCRRRRRRNNYSSEKVELDPEPAANGAFMQETPSSDIHAQPLSLPSNYAPSSTDMSDGTAPTASAFTTSTPPETPRERRRRLKQMQVTVQQLQRNLSVSQPDDDAAESQVAAQQRQIDMLLDEVERLRAIVARDEALPAYQE
ncbi:hypothetical protein B0H19DRAFT_1226412 [Mycena capillaripes]|nr:hypothetical protein B0H19DRAFT_1226412 [Mycena capillaripes]